MSSLFKLLFGLLFPEPAPPDPGAEHAVIVHVTLAGDGADVDVQAEELHNLENQLRRAVTLADVGELDGDEFVEDVCTISMYGPHTERLWDAIAPVLEKHTFRKGSHAIKRFGEPGRGREERVDLHWDG